MSIKNSLGNVGLKYIGKKMDGKKTYAGAIGKMLTGIGTMLTGVIGLIGKTFPDQGLPQMEFEPALVAISGGFYMMMSGLQGIGIGHKIEKSNNGSV